MMQTVVPGPTGKTHEGKVVPSPKTKHNNKDAGLLHLTVQNCNRLRKEACKCRLANSMDAEEIDACCLTGTHLPTMQSERWDLGHTVLTSGVVQPKRGRGTQGVGVCLSQKAVVWHEAAGSHSVRSHQQEIRDVPPPHRHNHVLFRRMACSHLERTTSCTPKQSRLALRPH
jgi:hypothetical protein